MSRNKRRILIAALAASIMISSSYASSLEFSLSPAVPAGSYITDGGDVTYVDISKHVSPGFIVSVGGFADIYPWLSVGGVSYIDTRSLLDNPGAFLTVPVMAALRFSYPSERFDIPLTLMAGFHAQTAGEDVRLGPAFAASLGLGTTWVGYFDPAEVRKAYELPDYEPESGGEGESSAVNSLDKRDPMFDEIARWVVAQQQGSTSAIQRTFGIGYNRAGRISDQLEAAGIVSPNNGSKGRQVLIMDEYSLEKLLESL